MCWLRVGFLTRNRELCYIPLSSKCHAGLLQGCIGVLVALRSSGKGCEKGTSIGRQILNTTSPLTTREVYQVLKDVALGTRITT